MRNKTVLPLILFVFIFSATITAQEKKEQTGQEIMRLSAQGISADPLLGFDTDGIPMICGTINDDLYGKPQEVNLVETRGWETIPNVIRADGVDTFVLEVDVNSPATSVSLEGVGGFLIPPESGPITLRDDGQGMDRIAGDFVFTAGSFRFNPSAQLPDFYELNLDSPSGLYITTVGTVHIEETDTTTQFLLRPSIGILRSDIEETDVVSLTPEIQVSPHLINVSTDTRATQLFLRQRSDEDLQQITRKIYEVLPDEFDFFIFLSSSKVELIPRFSSRNFVAGTHLTVQVNYTGTGPTPFDRSSDYGSSGRLLSVNALDAYDRGMNGRAATHEILHQWGAFIDPSLGLSDGAHYTNWSSVGSLLGGFQWIDNSDGTFTINCDEGRNGATYAAPLDKYLMGLIDASEVSQLYTYDTSAPIKSCSQGNPIVQQGEITTTVTIDDIQAIHGTRTPGPSEALRSFNIAFVIESHERLLNPTEMTFYEILAEHYTLDLPPANADPIVTEPGWQPVTRFFSEGVTWQSKVPMNMVAIPTFSPEPGTYTTSIDVTISTLTNEATIYFTTDGSAPTDSSQVYSAPIHITTTTTIKAKAFRPGFIPSEMVEANYDLNITSAATGENGVPSEFSLFQNYPNPFNPSTTIKYSLAAASYVFIKIYNVLGEKVSTLVNEKQEAGFYSAVWDGKNNIGQQVSSGIYLYRIETKNFVQSRKMLVIR